MAIREKEIYQVLRKYTEVKGHFRTIYTGVHCYTHPYMCGNFESILMQDLFSLDDNEYVARFYWLNWNRSWAKLNMKQGDLVDFAAYGEKYKLGSESHQLNPMRVPRVIYRLKYPSAISIIGNCEIPNPILDFPVMDLSTGIEYSNYCEYCKHSPFTRYPEGKDLGLIQLIDSINWDMIWRNRAGQLNCENYKPKVCFSYVFNSMPEEFQQIIVGKNYKPSQ